MTVDGLRSLQCQRCPCWWCRTRSRQPLRRPFGWSWLSVGSSDQRRVGTTRYNTLFWHILSNSCLPTRQGYTDEGNWLAFSPNTTGWYEEEHASILHHLTIWSNLADLSTEARVTHTQCVMAQNSDSRPFTPVHLCPVLSGFRNAGMLVGPGFFALTAWAVKRGQPVAPVPWVKILQSFGHHFLFWHHMTWDCGFPQSFWHVARVWLMICSKQNLESCYCGEESVLELHPYWLCPTVHNLSVAADYMNRSPKLSTVLRRLAQGKSLVHWLDLLSKTDLHVIWVHITYMHYMRDCDVLACFISCMKSVGLWSSRPCLPESSLGVGSVLFMLLNLPSSSPSCAYKIHRCHVFFSHGWLGTPPLHWHFVQGWSGWSGFLG